MGFNSAFKELKRPVRQADHSPASSAKWRMSEVVPALPRLSNGEYVDKSAFTFTFIESNYVNMCLWHVFLFGNRDETLLSTKTSTK